MATERQYENDWRGPKACSYPLSTIKRIIIGYQNSKIIIAGLENHRWGVSNEYTGTPIIEGNHNSESIMHSKEKPTIVR